MNKIEIDEKTDLLLKATVLIDLKQERIEYLEKEIIRLKAEVYKSKTLKMMENALKIS